MFNREAWIKDRATTISWAKRYLGMGGWVILDTETTGLDDNDEIVQISVLSSKGEALMGNQLIKPTVPIKVEASRVHGIGSAEVAGAPSFSDVWPTLANLLILYEFIIYNADFDTRMLRQSAKPYGLTIPSLAVHDAMLHYAAFLGDWNDKFQNYRWPKLQGGDHSSLGDCTAVLRLMRTMAAAEAA